MKVSTDCHHYRILELPKPEKKLPKAANFRAKNLFTRKGTKSTKVWTVKGKIRVNSKNSRLKIARKAVQQHQHRISKTLV